MIYVLVVVNVAKGWKDGFLKMVYIQIRVS